MVSSGRARGFVAALSPSFRWCAERVVSAPAVGYDWRGPPHAPGRGEGLDVCGGDEGGQGAEALTYQGHVSAVATFPAATAAVAAVRWGPLLAVVPPTLAAPSTAAPPDMDFFSSTSWCRTGSRASSTATRVTTAWPPTWCRRWWARRCGCPRDKREADAGHLAGGEACGGAALGGGAHHFCQDAGGDEVQLGAARGAAGRGECSRGGGDGGGGYRRCWRERNDGWRAVLEVRDYLFSTLGRRFRGVIGAVMEEGWDVRRRANGRERRALCVPPRIRRRANARARRVHRDVAHSAQRSVPPGWPRTFPPQGLPPGTTPRPPGPLVCIDWRVAANGAIPLPAHHCFLRPVARFPSSEGLVARRWALRGGQTAGACRGLPATAEASGDVGVGVFRGGSRLSPPAVCCFPRGRAAGHLSVEDRRGGAMDGPSASRRRCRGSPRRPPLATGRVLCSRGVGVAVDRLPRGGAAASLWRHELLEV